MNKHTEFSHIYKLLPWYDKADLYFFGVFLFTRQKLFRVGQHQGQIIPFAFGYRTLSKFPRIPKGTLVIAATLNLLIWFFALPVVPNLATPIIITHLIGLAWLYLTQPNPVLSNQEGRQTA